MSWREKRSGMFHPGPFFLSESQTSAEGHSGGREARNELPAAILRGQQLRTEQAGRGAVPEATPGKVFTPLGWALSTASSSQRGETNPDLQTHHHPRDRAGSIHRAGPPDEGFNRIKNKMNVKTVPSFEGSWKHAPPHSSRAPWDQ